MVLLSVLVVGLGAFTGYSNAQQPTKVDVVAITAAGPTITSPASSSTGLSPCGIVSSKSARFLLTTPPAKPFVLPSEALACLQSVPLDLNRSSALVDYIMPYMEFQTTLEYLANPPPGYLVPGVDIIGGFKNIKQNLQTSVYNSQWAFELDLHELINVLPKDGHLVWALPLMGTFQFVADQALISVSDDGLAIPEVFFYRDKKSIQQNSSLDYTPSPVVALNGSPAVDFLQSLSLSIGGQQDPDALYNLLFPSIPYGTQGTGKIQQFADNAYPMSFLGDSMKWTFGNRTTIETPNFAFIKQNFAGIDDGAALFSVVDLPQSAPTNAVTSTTVVLSVSSYYYPPSTSEPPPMPTEGAAGGTAPSILPNPMGYPTPVVRHYANIVAGYFLNGSEVSDVAVLSISAFQYDQPDVRTASLEFQRIVQEFLASCVANGKKKLIVDLSANGGGQVFLGYDTFKQLFPTLIPFGGSRFRDSPVFGYLSNVTTITGDVFPRTQEFNSQFQTQSNLDAHLEDFPIWQAFYGPQQFNGGNFTELLRFNLSDTIRTDITVSGYGDRAHLTPQPFAAKDIVLVYDGFCASTCTIFSDAMKRQAGVRSISLGGRPQDAPMQALGGTKGSSVLGTKYFRDTMIQAKAFTPEAVQSGIDLPPAPTTLSLDEPPLGAAFASLAPCVNARNAYPSDNQDGPPLQFVYEAANCRLFYKFEDLLDITHTWSRIANVAWGNGTCVPESTITTDNRIPLLANATVPYSDNAISNASLPSGAGNIKVVPMNTLGSTTSSSAASASAAPTMTSKSAATIDGPADSVSLAVLVMLGLLSTVFGGLL